MTLITVSVISRHGVSLEQRSCKPLVNAAFVRNQRYPLTNSSPLFFFRISRSRKEKKYFPGNDSFSGVNDPEISRGEGGKSGRKGERILPADRVCRDGEIKLETVLGTGNNGTCSSTPSNSRNIKLLSLRLFRNSKFARKEEKKSRCSTSRLFSTRNRFESSSV